MIGWQASSSNYVAHELSGKNNSNDIACRYSKDHSAVIYRICKLSLSPMRVYPLYYHCSLLQPLVTLLQSIPVMTGSVYTIFSNAMMTMTVLMAVMNRDVIQLVCCMYITAILLLYTLSLMIVYPLQFFYQ